MRHRLLSRVRLFVTPWTTALQAPLSMGFSSQEYWSRLLFPTPRNLLNPGIIPVSPAPPSLQANSLPLSHLGSIWNFPVNILLTFSGGLCWNNKCIYCTWPLGMEVYGKKKKKNSGGDFQLAQRKRGKSLGVGVASSPVFPSTLPNKKFLFLFHLMYQSHCNQTVVTCQLELNMIGSKCNARSRTES